MAAADRIESGTVCTSPLPFWASPRRLRISRLAAPARAAAMPEDTGAVQWVGRQAVVRLPEQIGSANADQVRELLLWLINRGPVVLIADLTSTLSCDYSGADALARAYQRAAAGGTELRLVVTADAVRSVLRLNGLHRLVSMYPTLQAAFAAGRNGHQKPEKLGTAAFTVVPPGPGQSVRAPADSAADLLDSAVTNIFSVALSLQDVAGLPHEIIVQRITEALSKLDDAVRDIRDHVFAGQSQGRQPDAFTWHPPEIFQQPLGQTLQRSIFLRQRLAEAERALHASAARTAALMVQRASLLEEPHRIDYPTRIKRWRVVADKAQQMAERLEDEHRPDA